MSLKVALIMGSDSDWKFLETTCRTLQKLQIPFEAKVISAHRSPELLREYVQSAENCGFGVFIAAAGGAAHLPGVIAAQTVLPVIGVPIQTSTMGGLDSLLSISQMPSGIPVATMSVGSGGPKNAALFAAQILAVGDESLRRHMVQFRNELAAEVATKDKRLQESVTALFE